MRNFNVVLVDDDKDLLEVIKMSLENEFQVNSFSDSTEALKYVTTNNFDALVMDYHMPGKNSFQMFRDLRNHQIRQPVLFLTGDADPKLKIEGLDMGVDDFLFKPISAPELSAHLKNRIRSYRDKFPSVIHVRNLEINTDFPEVKLDGEVVSLTRKEFDILAVLATYVNTVVAKETILKSVWSNITVEENNLDTHLSNLRKKIKGFDGRIRTLKGFGYVMRDN